jgi:sterol desaturase/sphingolipid hydroxylase (fatty acid hydroxylase superfamily)
MDRLRIPLLKSRDGIPPPLAPPRDVDMAREARTARTRFYPVTIAYSAYAVAVLLPALRMSPRAALAAVAAGIVSWTLIEYLFHRYILHGPFPDEGGPVRRWLHDRFDGMHADHHQRPWDGHHINGRFESVPAAILLAAVSFLMPWPAGPVFVATILQCYVLEEWIHYAVHFHGFKGRYFAHIRRHHLYHHGVRGRDVAFGLTSALWDQPFGTRIEAPDRARVYRAPRHRRLQPSPRRGWGSSAHATSTSSERPTRVKACTARSMWSAVWAAESCTRIRDWPRGTTGKKNPFT